MKINDIVNEQQLDEFGFNDIQKGAKKITKGAQKFTKNVNKTGDAVAGAASAIGGAGKALGNQMVARPVAGAYNAVKSGAKGLGKAAATVAGDVAGGAGAVAGGATTGVARAASKGFNTGANAVGGEPADKLGKVFKQDPVAQPTATASNTSASSAGVDAASIENQIDQHKTAISGLQAQLAQARGAQAQTQAQATQAPATTPQSTNSLGTKIGNAVGNVASGIANAVKRGANAGVGNVADQPTGMNSVSIKDRSGKTTPYKKLGNQWFGPDNKQVDANMASLLDQQAQSQATPSSPDYVGRRAVARGQATANPTTATTAPAATAPVDDRFPKDANAPAAPTVAPVQTTPPAAPTVAPAPASTKAKTAYNVPTSSTPSVTAPPFKNPQGTATVTSPDRKTPGAILPTQRFKDVGTTSTTPVNKVNYKLSSSDPNMKQYYANKRAQNQQTNGTPALAESSKDFSALLLDKTK